jgi:hypothetical protein
MLKQLINHSPDLAKLQSEGYRIEISEGGGHLIVHRVPYLTASREVKYGKLVAVLNLASPSRAGQPPDHTIYFAGEQPHNFDGSPINANNNQACNLENSIAVNFYYSRKPPGGTYPDYYEKITTYIMIFGSQASAVDPNATARPDLTTAKDEQ